MFGLSFIGIFVIIIFDTVFAFMSFTTVLIVLVFLLLSLFLWLHFYNFGRGMKKLESVISQENIELKFVDFLRFIFRVKKGIKFYELSFYPAIDFYTLSNLPLYFVWYYFPDHYQIKREIPLERFTISENLRSTIENIRISLFFFKKKPKIKLAEHIYEKAPHLLEEANKIESLRYVSLIGSSGRVWATALLDYQVFSKEFSKIMDILDKVVEIYENK